MGELEPLTAAFNSAGHTLYIVGGVVRDLYAGTWNDADADLDLTTDAKPQQIIAIAKPLVDSLWTIGERFGTIGLVQGARTIEITAHRADVYRTSSRKPQVRFGTSLLDDLARRDFTINAMAIDLGDGSRNDPFDGLDDLAARLLRTPQTPESSFSDDPLRMVRAARFVARFGLTPDLELASAATAMSDRLSIVSIERVQVEMERLLELPDPAPGLEFLDKTGLLAEIVPSLPRDAQRRSAILAMAARPVSVDVRRSSLVWFSYPNTADLMKRLRYPGSITDRTIKIIRGAKAMNQDRSIDELVRVVVAEVGESLVDEVISLQRGRAQRHTAQLVKPAPGIDGFENPEVDLAFVDEFDHAYRRLSVEEDLGDLSSPLSGAEIMQYLDLAPGPRVGEALKYLRSCRLRSGPLDRDVAYRLLDNWVRGSCDD